MSIHAGRPLRIELYGLAFAATVAGLWINDKLNVQLESQRRLVKEMERPQVIQQNNNHQHVTVESENDRIVREIAKNRGWIEDVDGNAGNANGTSVRLPSERPGNSGAGKR
jgi:hypothetical protein